MSLVKSRAAHVATVCALLFSTAALTSQSADAAVARPSAVGGPHPVSPMSGSGTVTDPWVPSKSANIVCQSATVWGNYNGSTHSTPLGTVYYGDTVSVRYETSDHNSVMAYSARANTWGFILRSCVQFA